MLSRRAARRGLDKNCVGCGVRSITDDGKIFMFSSAVVRAKIGKKDLKGLENVEK